MEKKVAVITTATKWVRLMMVALVGLMGSAVAAHATDPPAPDPTIYAGIFTTADTYISSLVSTHGVTAVGTSLIVMGLFFVWGLLRRAFHTH